jgi:hypothetical protein
VNANALECLRQSFETQRLLDAVDQVDSHGRVGQRCHLPEWSAAAARHGAHHIIRAPRATSNKETIWELAGALAKELEEVVADLHASLKLFHQLAELAPEIAGESGSDMEEEDL